MGVPGLMSYILANRERCVEYVDLVERARQAPDGWLELLVDMHSFQHLLVRKFTANLEADNPFVCVQGGEYALFDAWVKKLVGDLAAVGVRLAWFADASRGCCKRTDEQRGRVWQRRQREEVQRQSAWLSWCSGYSSEPPAGVEPIRSVCLEQQLLGSIRSAGCRVQQAVRGEADYALAQELLTNRRALAAISGDSDLCVFRDGVLIPLDLFDIHGDLGLDGGAGAAASGGHHQPPLPERPLRLVVGLVSGPSVMRLLAFPTWDLLLDLSVVMGNDFTGPLLGNRDAMGADLGVRPVVKTETGVGRLKLEDFATFLRATGGLANSSGFERRMAANPRLRSAVEHSRQFYTLMLIEGVDGGTAGAASRCPLDAHLESGVLAGRYASTLVAMRRGRYWRRVCLEDDTPGHPSAEEGAAVTLRDWAHRCLIADGENDVREEFDPRDGGRWIRRRAAPRRVRGVDLWPLPDASARGRGPAAAAAAFCELLGLAEAAKAYGWRSGAMCAALRHFLAANCPPRLLCLDPDEALAVGATALGLHLLRPAWYARLPVRPSVRCVTVASAWLAAFRSAFGALAPALGLPPDEAPTPAEAFSGAVFSAMFMLRAHGGSGLRHLDGEAVSRVERDRVRVLREKRHVLARIMDGLYPSAGDDAFWR